MPPHLPLLLPENLAWMALLENSPNTKEEAGITLTLKPEEKNYRPGPSGTEVQNTLKLAQRCTCKLQKASQTMHLVAWGDEGLAVPPAAPTGECQGCAHPACAAGAPDGSRGPPRWSALCIAAAVSPGFAGASSAAGRAEPGSPTAGCSCLTGRGAPTTSPAGPPETGEEAG